MTSRAPDLGASILAAERAARWVVPALAVAAGDPFRLDLPPLPGPATGAVDGPTMETLGGLYLIALLEQTGMLRTVELLSGHRLELDIPSVEAAEALDAVAVESTEWYPAAVRDQLYARVFGVGPGATSSTTANTGFPGLLLDLCSAVTAADGAAAVSSPTAPRHRALVARAVGQLVANLSVRQHGNTLVAARRIAVQVRSSFDLLSHPGIIAVARGRTMWDVVRSAWGNDAPDIDRLVTTGQSGQQLLGWAGSSGGAAGEPTPSAAEAAALWLSGAGFDLEDAA